METKPTVKPLPYIPTCPHCGSTDLVADAAVRWNVHTQAWNVLTTVMDNVTCQQCGVDEVKSLEVPAYEVIATAAHWYDCAGATIEPAEKPIRLKGWRGAMYNSQAVTLKPYYASWQECCEGEGLLK